MNYFEGELRKLFGDGSILDNPTFVGRACFGDIGKDLRARIDFISPKIADHYSSLRMTIMNRTDGVIDCLELRLEELLGMKTVPGNPNFRHGVSPYIWVFNGKAEWYAFTPTETDYRKIRESVGSYVDVFRPRDQARGNELSGLKAPLDDQVKKAETHTAKSNAKSHAKSQHII